jgi:hypothetical protein
MLNYNEGFIDNLKKQIQAKIALVSNKDYKNQVYSLGLSSHMDKYEDLLQLYTILDKILKCASCYSDIEIEDVVSLTKSKLNLC